MPYPNPSLKSVDTIYEDAQDFTQLFGKIVDMELIPAHLLNPFALGHKMNHPPPDVAANVLFIDFEIPYTWFPSALGQYIPVVE